MPQTLLELVTIIHECPDIKYQSGSSGAVLGQETLSVAQSLQFSSYIRRRSGISGFRNNKASKTPLPICAGVAIHEKIRKRKLMNKLSELGLSIS